MVFLPCCLTDRTWVWYFYHAASQTGLGHGIPTMLLHGQDFGMVATMVAHGLGHGIASILAHGQD